MCVVGTILLTIDRTDFLMNLIQNLGALALMLGAALSSVAAPVTYTYTFSGSNNSITCCASYNYEQLNNTSKTQVVDISGTFLFDTTSKGVTSANVTLTTSPKHDTMFTGYSMNFTTITRSGNAFSDPNLFYLQLVDVNGDSVQFLFNDATNLNSGLSVALNTGVYYTNYSVNTPGLYFDVFDANAQNQLIPIAGTTTGYAVSSSVPEPASLALVVTALAGLGACRRRTV